MIKKFIYSKFNKNKSCTFDKLRFGNIGIKIYSYGYITEQQINLIKTSFIKSFKKNKNIIYNFCLNKIFTKKPLDSRLGCGKGAISLKKYKVKPGMILAEFKNIKLLEIYDLLNLLSYKLSIKFKIIKIN